MKYLKKRSIYLMVIIFLILTFTGCSLPEYKGCGEVTGIYMMPADEPFMLDGHTVEMKEIDGRFLILCDGNQCPVYGTTFIEWKGKFIVDDTVGGEGYGMVVYPVGSKYVSFCETIENYKRMNIWLVIECNSECSGCAIKQWSTANGAYYSCKLCTVYDNFVKYAQSNLDIYEVIKNGIS